MLKRFSITVFISVLSLQATTLDDIVSTTLAFAEYQVLSTVSEIDTNSTWQYPRWVDIAQSGKWHSSAGHKWTSGFYPGCLWYLYKHTNNPMLKRYALSWTNGLKPTKHRREQWPDMGLIIMPSYGNGFRITGDSSYIPIIIKAAQTYIDVRWNANAKTIDSWDKEKWTQNPEVVSGAVDQLMNIEILFMASQLSEDPKFSNIAKTYALHTMKYTVRNDYSTFHIGRYNVLTGEVVNQGTIQGYSDASTWSRGQAWSIYGYTMSYRYTKDKRFINTAKKLAHYYIDHLPPDHVPYWDFHASNIPDEPRDASAAAVVCSALFELISFMDDEDEITKFQQAAFDMLKSLASKNYLANPEETNAILLHSTAYKPANKRIDVPLIYADYYFIEALLRYQAYQADEPIVPSPGTPLIKDKQTKT